MAEKLSELLVGGLTPPERGASTIWDSETTGFGVRVFAPTDRKPGGARSFFLNYRIDGVERRFTIGSFPDWSVKAARIEAKALRQRIDKGEDPTLDKRARREAPTVRVLAERYIRDHLPTKAERSQREDEQIIKVEILPYRSGKDGPLFGDRKVADIHQGDMKALHAALTKRGVPVRANRVLSVASKMFSLALIPMEGEIAPWRDRVQGNPCQGVARNAEEGLERFLSPMEISALTDAIAARGDTPATNCVKLIMLSGCRPGEAILATWDQFDAEPGYWVKPSSHTKQRKTHRVPLTPGALELLEKVRKGRGKSARSAATPYVFPGQKPGAPLKQLRSTWEDLSGYATVSLWGESTDARIVQLIADFEGSEKRRPTVDECKALAEKRGVNLPDHLLDARLYDLRHTFASFGAGAGISLQIIGRLLGHTQTKTTMRYAHLADDPLVEANRKIGGLISGAGLEGAEVRQFKTAG